MQYNDRVVVAIPTFNEAQNIETVIRTIATEKAELPGLEIAVIDGGSRDETVAIARRIANELPFVHVFSHPGEWISAAVNFAAAFWTGKADVMIRCDAHAHYPKRFVSRLVKTLHETGAASVVVPMDSVGRDGFEKAVAWVSDTPMGSGGSAHRGGHKSGFIDHGHHAAFRLENFVAVRGYDEAFICNEDAELDCRIRAAGGKIYLDANIRVDYYPRKTAKALWKQYFKYGLGRSQTIKRHSESVRLRQVAVPGHLLFTLFSCMAAAVAHSALFLAWPMLYLAMLAATSLAVAVKHRSACGLLAGPAALIMHTAWGLGFLRGFLFLEPSVMVTAIPARS
ncbi:MAG TPA: glycosyltransferase family 2 protein [Rhizomicrobium sp.]|nr:glycosyltransferase family 2 protein [Rhizomicrobium sp.]